jgi:hypothetical protein
MQRIRVSENRRFLVTESGEPFFWLADTAWELFHRLTIEEAEIYLENRRERGFNVIQAVALAEFDGLQTPNAYGDLPLIDLDPARPNEAYFQYVDQVIRLAAAKGLYIGLLPTWGDKVVKLWGTGPEVFNPQNARIFGEYLGRRYGEQANVIWILGGDRPGEGLVDLWTAMAEGIDAGQGCHRLTTLHPSGGHGSSEWFHDCEWLDFNMWQSGHSQTDAATWEMISQDYNRALTKPVLDGEPNYEDHPIDPFSRQWEPRFGRFNDYDVRKQGYRSVFAGGCGYTYGHHTIWQFYKAPRTPINHPALTWDEAIYRPGAAQLTHLKNLLLSRPYLERIPDQELLLSEAGAGGRHVRATRDAAGSYAFVYVPLSGQTVAVDLSHLTGPICAWWYDPRSGKAFRIGDFKNNAATEFTSPLGGPDWVLVLDEAGRNYPPPGVKLAGG